MCVRRSPDGSGCPKGGIRCTNCDVEGIVEVTLDATTNAAAPISAERLYGWHATLFPVG